ncbi:MULTISPECIES: CcmD family protein [Neobacillus]|jgi:CcmD family protein|uniref:CcmD family protein n=1 Tax=Neobacillus citreus TaxID=2833578 RepID=A0A942T2T3_9BACI|nr:CcmD family protein [Neobacillus citreus]MCH6266672.1 CcmD family protein [Neobacillus citreus]
MNYEYMLGAYSVAWVVIFAYMLIIGKRHDKLKKEIEFLKQLDK